MIWLRWYVKKGIKVVTTGAGTPGKYMDMWKAHDIKGDTGGTFSSHSKANGKRGRCGNSRRRTRSCVFTTMVLVPQIVDAVDVPVIAQVV